MAKSCGELTSDEYKRCVVISMTEEEAKVERIKQESRRIMTLELEEKEARWKELHHQSCKIGEQMSELDKELKCLRLKRLLETDLLSKVEWHYSYNLGIRGPEVDGFGQLLKPWGYHDRFEADGWTLSFDDGKLGLGFCSAAIIKDHNMKVNFCGLRSEVKQAEHKYLTIKALADALGVDINAEEDKAAGTRSRGKVC